MKRKFIESFASLLLALLIGFLVSAIFIIAIGVNPFVAYRELLKGAFWGKVNIIITLRWTIPYLVVGLASAVAIKAGVFNMGLDGCIYLGALSAALVGAYITGLPSIIHILLCLVVSMIVGIIWTFIPAWLKAYHNINEVIITWMLSYIAILLCQYLVTNYFQRSEDIIQAVQQVRTPPILDSAKLKQIVKPYQLSSGLYIALFAALCFYIFYNKTIKGYEHTMTGLSPKFAEYAGINVKKIQFTALLSSGAIAGLAGAIEVLGVHYRYIHGFSSNMGANGIMVSLMGRLSPIGISIASLFMGGIQNGARAMARETNVSLDTMQIFIAVIVICITAEGLYEILKIKPKMREGD